MKPMVLSLATLLIAPPWAASPALAADRGGCPTQALKPVLDDASLNLALQTSGLVRTGHWERDGGCFETHALTAEGRTVEVRLDAYTGKLVFKADDRARERDDDSEREGSERQGRAPKGEKS